MRYNLANPTEVTFARKYFEGLVAKKVKAEIKKISPKRSLSQNSYLHLLLSAFAVEFGWTLAEAKTIYKREVNPDTFVYTKNNQKFIRSSRDLSVDEMQKSIDRFMQYSSEHGLDLPLAENKEAIMYYQNLVEQQGQYL